MLPCDQLSAIIVRMSYKDIARVDLENTVRRLLETSPAPNRHPAVANHGRSQAGVKSCGDIEKTAHDLRASLNIIIGFSELMLDEAMGKINKEQRRSLKDILNNGKRLYGLSDEIIRRLEDASGNNK